MRSAATRAASCSDDSSRLQNDRRSGMITTNALRFPSRRSIQTWTLVRSRVTSYTAVSRRRTPFVVLSLDVWTHEKSLAPRMSAMSSNSPCGASRMRLFSIGMEQSSVLGRICYVLQGATSSPKPVYSPALDLANFMPLCRGNRCLQIRSIDDSPPINRDSVCTHRAGSPWQHELLATAHRT